MLNIGNKIFPLPIWHYISKPLCTFVQLEQHMILAKFYANNALDVGSYGAKFNLNLLTQTIATVNFVSHLKT